MSTGSRKPTVDEMIPPPGMEDVGGGDFKAIGEGIVGTLKIRDDCALKPGESFLDMGCGIGRVAIPLTQYFTESARYEGFDVMKSAIQYCTEKITPHYPNFRFTHSDVHNKRYNPSGKTAGDAYRFPYADASFDFAMATSLFTHLLSAASAHYLSEAARVLKPGGRFLATFFLLDDEARALMKEKKTSISFPFQVEPSCWAANESEPEAALCYDESFVRRMYREAGFEIVGDIGWGHWSGRKIPWGGYQDQVVAVRS
jgi:ubiquinone/menaquinone biosynthesis C-methylase UbiE